MLELPVTAARSCFEPTIGQQKPNNVSHFHCETFAARTVAYEA
jgi:hypothetical protein